jgi:hypothetical protein
MSIAKSIAALIVGTAALASTAAATVASTAVASTAVTESPWFAPSMRFEPSQGSLEVTFGMDESARISLLAFDTQGKLLATLVDGTQGAGFHHLSLFSNRLQGQSGKVVFQLRSGNTVLAESRTRARL